MATAPKGETGSLADFEAAYVIRRAAELQAMSADRTSLNDLKALAAEVGIESEYVDLALAELRNRNPRAFTMTLSSPLPFAPSANHRPLDPLERRESLTLISSANEERSIDIGIVSHFSTRSPRELDQTVSTGLNGSDWIEVSSWIAQHAKLNSPVVLTSEALVGEIDFAGVNGRLRVVSRFGRTRLSIKFRTHGSWSRALGVIGLVPFGCALAVVTKSIGFALLAMFLSFIAVAIYAASGNKARLLARQFLEDMAQWMSGVATA